MDLGKVRFPPERCWTMPVSRRACQRYIRGNARVFCAFRGVRERRLRVDTGLFTTYARAFANASIRARRRGLRRAALRRGGCVGGTPLFFLARTIRWDLFPESG